MTILALTPVVSVTLLIAFLMSDVLAEAPRNTTSFPFDPPTSSVAVAFKSRPL